VDPWSGLGPSLTGLGGLEGALVEACAVPGKEKPPYLMSNCVMSWIFSN